MTQDKFILYEQTIIKVKSIKGKKSLGIIEINT